MATGGALDGIPVAHSPPPCVQQQRSGSDGEACDIPAPAIGNGKGAVQINPAERMEGAPRHHARDGGMSCLGWHGSPAMKWTAEGRLRHAIFLGYRTDKSATDVRRES